MKQLLDSLDNIQALSNNKVNLHRPSRGKDYSRKG